MRRRSSATQAPSRRGDRRCVGDGVAVGVGEHSAGLLGQFLAVREPDDLVPTVELLGQQRACDDRFAAARGQLEHQANTGAFRQCVLQLLVKCLLVRAEFNHLPDFTTTPIAR